MFPGTSKMPPSQDGLVLDVNFVHAKSAASRIASDLNLHSAQTSTSTFATRRSPIDYKSSSRSPRHTSGICLVETKAHNRQTSIVHGYQHSRDGSAASTSSTPLSPQLIAAVVGDRIDNSNMDYSIATVTSSNTNVGTSLSSLSLNMTVRPDHSSIHGDDGSSQNSTLRKSMRLQNGRGVRDSRQNPSHSRQQPAPPPSKEEVKSPGEYAVHAISKSFIALAEEKINIGIANSSDTEPHIEKICGPRVDPAFDYLISVLAHIASQKPKPLIDAMMLWRKSKSDAASEARSQLQQSKHHQGLRRNTEPLRPENINLISNLSTAATRQEAIAQAERRSTASIYVLCRVLIEVISQSTLAQITLEVEEKLEGIIFGQLKAADADQLKKSPIKLANWFLFSKLLGVMSEINFKSVSDRFIADLEKLHRELPVKSSSNRELQERMELIIGGMKYLRVKLQPEELWDQSCEFLISIGRIFAQSHGHRLKYAFCQALENLLLPVAAQFEIELKIPKWSEVLGTIGPSLASMLVKPQHWSIAFPLTATLLCVSPIDSFTTQWLQLVLPLQSKLKDRFVRPICLQVISRLIWTYLYRASTDSLNTTIKKLEEVLKLILPTGRKTYLTTDPSSVDSIIQTIRIIGFKHQDFCFRTVIFPLISADLFTSGQELKIEQLEPEKMMISIKAFVAIISDLEKGENGRPLFPYNRQIFPLTDRLQSSPTMTVPRSLATADNQPNRAVINSTALSEIVMEYYTKFCEILGKITLACDYAFGSLAVPDEKLNSPNTKISPSESANSGRQDNYQSPHENRLAFYELLDYIVKIFPRFWSVDVPVSNLISLLCTGTAHIQDKLAESSADSLKSIARQSHAQQVVISYSRFIFSFDDRFSTISEGGMLGSSQIEDTLQLYFELLQIWLEEIKCDTKESATGINEETNNEKRGIRLNLSGICAYVDEVEGHALFFLCSQSGNVRALAISVLRFVKELDTVLGNKGKRLIQVLEEEWKTIMNFDDSHISAAERSRLRGMREGVSENTLIEFCSRKTSYDMSLWLKIFPNLIRICYERCPSAIKITRGLIGNRILQMYKSVVAFSERTVGTKYGITDQDEYGNSRVISRSSTTPPEIIIEQWKLYLIFNFTTLSDRGGYSQSSSSPQLFRKGSNQNYVEEEITSARVLFKYILPLLSVGSTSIRESVVVSLGCVNIQIYKILLEEIRVFCISNDEAKSRIHRRTTSNASKNRRADLLRTEITHVYQLTAHFLKEPIIYRDDWVLNHISAYTKDLELFLMEEEVKSNWEFQKLRRYYCGLMEKFFEGIKSTNNMSRWMSYETKKSSFTLMEEWCGFSPNESLARKREESIKQFIIEQQSNNDTSNVTAAVEIEKRNLRLASLSAMETLCDGPMTFNIDSHDINSEIERMLSWIDTTLTARSDRIQVIGRKALKNLITQNQDLPCLLESSVARCYTTEHPKSFEIYFGVITQVLVENPNYSIPVWRVLAIILFTLLSESSDTRSKSLQLFEVIEERQVKNINVYDYNIYVCDKTRTIYKLVQTKISEILSKQYPQLAFFILSEFANYYKNLPRTSQQNILTILLPWTQLIELQIESTGELEPQSLAFLLNLYEITAKSCDTLHSEIQAVWQSLVSELYVGNIQVILNFIISLCLGRREQSSVQYAKRIVTYLSNTPRGVKMVEYLLLQITPKTMVANEKCDLIPPAPDILKIPYVAELNDIPPIGTRSVGFSLGQLSFILLVDLVVSPSQPIADHLPLLLHVVTSLWDHSDLIIQENTREMLVHLIHEFVHARMSNVNCATKYKLIEGFIETIRHLDSGIFWPADDCPGESDALHQILPYGMERLVGEMIAIFNLTFPEIQEDWARLSLNWAISCSEKYLACRSFRIFRHLFTSLDQAMLMDLLEVLSKTISDKDVNNQALSIEILITFRTLIYKSECTEPSKFLLLFWTMCACLETTNEAEFQEVLNILDVLINKLNLNQTKVRSIISEGQPTAWEGQFQGLQKSVYKGLRSSKSSDVTIKMINKLTQLPNDNLIGDESRLIFAILANLPVFLHALDRNAVGNDNAQDATLLSETAQCQGYSNLSRVLNSYATSQYRNSKEFIAQLMPSIKEAFLPKWDLKALVFLMSFLTNSLAWFKIKTLQIIFFFLAEIDVCKPEITSQCQDLIMPLVPLLQTDCGIQALEVLDRILHMTNSPIVKLLSQNKEHSSLEPTNRHFEKSLSVSGVTEDSGWTVSVIDKSADTTRANLQKIHLSCQCTENTVPECLLTQKLATGNDDSRFFQPPERVEISPSDDSRGEGNLSELILKLDSLDGFFDSCFQSSASITSTSLRRFPEAAGFPDEGYEPSTRVSDGQALTPLYKCRSTPSSTLSFQNGFLDIKPAKPNTMNPRAFYDASLKRPSLHSRSATSPSASASSQCNGIIDMSDDDRNEFFSDGDDERHNPYVESSFFLENIIKPQSHSSRSSIRRLTSSRGREFDNIRDSLGSDGSSSRRGVGGPSQPPKSPKVPRVPSAYLSRTISPGQNDS